ncbi:MAG TPA: hypothetical protein VHM24_00465 [Gemmatimonadaceae bacterium]|nr:hypothetical protein [Gemmatimonadaceae bacterium]
MNAALGVRFDADFLRPDDFLAELFLAVDFVPDLEDDFFAELFFFAVAIASPEWLNRGGPFYADADSRLASKV